MDLDNLRDPGHKPIAFHCSDGDMPTVCTESYATSSPTSASTFRLSRKCTGPPEGPRAKAKDRYDAILKMKHPQKTNVWLTRIHYEPGASASRGGTAQQRHRHTTTSESTSVAIWLAQEVSGKGKAAQQWASHSAGDVEPPRHTTPTARGAAEPDKHAARGSLRDHLVQHRPPA